MKRNVIVVVGFLALFASLAFGATQFTRVLNLQVTGKTLIGSTAETNVITRAVTGSMVVDFDAGTIICSDAVLGLSGVLSGDPCFVGLPSGPAANSTFECFVSDAGEVTLRHCPHGTGINPASATYNVRVISAQ